MNKTNKNGLKNLATNFFDYQKTIPKDRYIEEEKREEPPKMIPNHVFTWLRDYMKSKGLDNEVSNNGAR